MNASAAINNVTLLIIGINLVLVGVISLAWLCYSLFAKKSTMVKNIMSLIVGLALIGYGTNLSVKFFTKKETASVEKLLKEKAEEINKTLPMMVDNETRLEEVSASGDVMNYRYTMVNYSVDQLNKEEFQASLENSLKSKQCSDQATINYFKVGASNQYNFHGNKGNLAATVVISNEACGIL